jgi:hypothetical protein
MMRKFGMILGVVGMFAMVGACSDDSGSNPPIRLDGGGGGDTGGGGNLDNGIPNPDTGGGNTQSCTEVLQCAAQCTDQNCIANCVSKGTADAATKFNALNACLQSAGTGACASDCSNPQSSACTACLQTTCKTEQDACLGGGGTPEAGFGDRCNQQKPCPTGMTCAIVQQGATDGFCTKPCQTIGELCPNAPTGTQAACTLSDGQGGNFCGFLCKAQGQTWSCPSDLACSTTEDQPGSGQFSCAP